LKGYSPFLVAKRAGEPVNILRIFIMLVKTEFTNYIGTDEYTTGNTNRQSKNINKGNDRVTPEVAPGHF
jgi:hypothetical protein